jgi:hypothetical protein
MSIRPETEFDLGEDKKFSARPTFRVVDALERRFGPINKMAEKINNGDFAMGACAVALQVILPQPKDGGPKQEEVENFVFDNYQVVLVHLFEFLLNALADPGAKPRPSEGDQAAQKLN